MGPSDTLIEKFREIVFDADTLHRLCDARKREHGTAPTVHVMPNTCLEESTNAPHTGKAATVLVVDDQDSIQQMVLRILKPLGYHVLPARNGHEALALYEKNTHCIDLVLTDVDMPEMDGIELYRKLHGFRKNVKVLFMTGSGSEVVIENRAREKATPLILKPFRPAELVAVVRALLDGLREPGN